jgi:hypothetical protein
MGPDSGGKGAAGHWSRSIRAIVSIITVLPLLAVLLPSPLQALHTFELGWVIGKVVVLQRGKYMYQSTGFVFRHGGRPYVITTNHTLEKIEREFGKGARVFFHSPILEEPVPMRLLFTEPSEDSAVFAIDGLPPGYEFSSAYESALSLSKEDTLVIYGYPDTASGRHEPETLKADFLTLATLNFGTNWLSLPPDLRESDSKVVLTRCEAPIYGMSGSPVIIPGTSSLVGMVKSFGNTKNNRELTERLDAVEFHIIVRLDRTVERIKWIKGTP